jgi:acetyl-CoA C-acetyltransferase
LCGSGLQAIVTAANMIQQGDADMAIGGGAENMSRSPYLAPSLRWGARMNDAKMVDMMVGALSDPFDDVHMGVTAENVAKKYGVSREDQDALAAESHRRAQLAIDHGYFRAQVVPVMIQVKREKVPFEIDETVRPDATADKLGKLKPVFDKAGTVTAGNASSINDAAAAVVLADRETAEKRGLKPMGRLVAYSYSGVDPKLMGMGPVPAVQKLLAKTGLKLDDIDVFEVNEAFAAQALAVCRELKLPMDRTNPNGSGISLGHPIGATGAILVIKALYELNRTAGKRALVTMCIGGGQGIAALLEHA